MNPRMVGGTTSRITSRSMTPKSFTGFALDECDAEFSSHEFYIRTSMGGIHSFSTEGLFPQHGAVDRMSDKIYYVNLIW